MQDSFDDSQLKIASVTGVDVEFDIAGVGSRSYAFVIDWHIRILLAFAWFVVALLLLNGAWSLFIPRDGGARYAFIALLPPLLIYFFYHPVLEIATRGRTPGKRMAGVRIVTRDGDVPSIGALLIRNVLRLVDSLPMMYLVGLCVAFVTKQHVRVGDLAAGTVLVFDHDRDGKSLARFDALAKQSHLDPQIAELADELLQRWKKLSSANRQKIAATLLARAERQDATQFLALSESQLHARLKKLVGERA